MYVPVKVHKKESAGIHIYIFACVILKGLGTIWRVRYLWESPGSYDRHSASFRSFQKTSSRAMKYCSPWIFQVKHVNAPFPTRRTGATVTTPGSLETTRSVSDGMPPIEHGLCRADRREQRLFGCLQHCCAPASSGQARLTYLPPHKGNHPRPISPSPSLLPYPPQDSPSLSLPCFSAKTHLPFPLSITHDRSTTEIP